MDRCGLELVASFYAFFMFNDCFIIFVCWKKVCLPNGRRLLFQQKPKTSYAKNTWWQFIHDSWKLQKNSHANSCFEGHFKKGSAQARRECTEETKGSVRTTIWHYMTLYDTISHYMTLYDYMNRLQIYISMVHNFVIIMIHYILFSYCNTTGTADHCGSFTYSRLTRWSQVWKCWKESKRSWPRTSDRRSIPLR